MVEFFIDRCSFEQVECIELFDEEPDDPDVKPDDKTETGFSPGIWLKRVFSWISNLFRRILGGD